MLGTVSLADFQDFLLLCGPLPFSERNDENRQSDKPWGMGLSKAPQHHPLLQAVWDCWSHSWGSPLNVSFPLLVSPKLYFSGDRDGKKKSRDGKKKSRDVTILPSSSDKQLLLSGTMMRGPSASLRKTLVTPFLT